MTGAHLLLVLDPVAGRPISGPESWVPVAQGLAGRAQLFASPDAVSRLDLVRRAPSDKGATVVLGVTVQGSPARTLAARLAGKATGSDSTSVDPGLQGQFAAALLEEHRAALWTDHLSTTPWYRAGDESGRVVLGTALWPVARLVGGARIDDISAREFLGRGAITAPYTLLEGVVMLPAASTTWLWLAGGPTGVQASSHPYWEPAPDRGPTRLADAADQLRGAVASLVDAVWSRYERPLLLLSGGEDSRVVAALAARGQDRGHVRAAILLDEPNREYRLAKLAASTLGVTVEPRWRDPRMYTDGLPELDDIVGPGADVRHAHAVGLIQPGEADVIVTGHGSDTFLKGDVLPTAPGPHAWSRTRRPDTPGWLEEAAFLAPMRHTGIQLDDEVVARRRAHLERVRAFRGDRDPEAWSLMWPMTEWSHHPFFTSTASIAPCASPYLTGAVVDAVGGITEDAKMGRALFARAFARDLGVSGLIPRSGGELPGLPGPFGRVVATGTRRSFAAWDARSQRRDSFVAPGPWLSDELIREQAHQELDAAEPGMVGRAMRVLVGEDVQAQVSAHPYPAIRLRQLVLDCERVGEAADESVTSNPLTPPLAVCNARGVRLHVDPDDRRGRALVTAGGNLNPISLLIWQMIVARRPWDLVVDVGANYGEMLLGAELPRDARVIAYEPSTAVLPYLRRSLAGQAQAVELRELAVGDRSGSADFLVDDEWSGTSRLAAVAGVAGNAVVSMVTLSSDLRHVEARTACIKIDVEGAEQAVLRGARAWLSGLDDYAFQIEILHLGPDHVSSLAREHTLFLWNISLGRFSRVTPCSPAEIQARLATGAYYPQDAVLTPPTPRVRRSR